MTDDSGRGAFAGGRMMRTISMCVMVLAATAAPVIVLVSCDLAALGRDSADLVALGYDHVRSTVLDLFPHTSHAEVVTRFVRR